METIIASLIIACSNLVQPEGVLLTNGKLRGAPEAIDIKKQCIAELISAFKIITRPIRNINHIYF